MFGTRFHFSFRAVIVPITGPHEYDELHLPWRLAVSLLEPFILAILTNRMRIPMPEAKRMHYRALHLFDQTIYDVIETLRNEAPGQCFSVIWGRNPSIHRGALQFLRVPRIKKDIHDWTVGMSPLILKDPNADRVPKYRS